jgi:hypothetical protein
MVEDLLRERAQSEPTPPDWCQFRSTATAPFQVESRWLAALELMPGPRLLAGERRDRRGGVVALLREG